ncbi:MAG: hemerythrin domain-containing protein [Planctomycetia bacterium]|nr:hemerythrin domain-containing protein [Planctomycetia bacterium]
MKRFFVFVIISFCLGISACASQKYNIYQEHKHVENTNPSVTDILHYDFDVIKRMLQILEKAAECLDKEQPISKENFTDIVQIITNFSDKHHQEKEDKVLFPALKVKNEGEKKDFLGRLLMEHVSARDKMRSLSESLNRFYQGKKARKKIAKIIRSYIKDMEKHIEMEEKILFPWINKTLTPDEQVIFVKKFDALEKDDLETGVHEKYSAMIERLEQQVGICFNSKE